MTNAFRIKTSVLLCSMALALPLTAAAEEIIVVTALQDAGADAPTAGYTAKNSTGATKTDKPLITTGQSISVITRQQIDDQGAMDLNQALNYTPGVFTNFAGAATRFDTISLRGFHGGDVDNTFLNGLRVMSDRALLNKSELADRMALYYTCYPILTLCGIPNNVIRFSALTIA
ncbi:TonB-dependent receptor plug domain-containing protein, partial [Sodalis sp. (in: enterobacteria)]|uniref:TonB-dependent receptor plug domain-containing protein n=1 Tax=Sodalis sp. (in: enterobacteria) TaxID=1898979 RepID=UPI003F39550C